MLKDALIIIACILGALVFLLVVTRTSAAPARKEANDFTGAVVAVIGTTYAVILAFMLSGVWNMFQQAQGNEELEANALTNMWRIAGQLGPPASTEVRALCLKYAHDAVDKEWPALAEDKPAPPETSQTVDQLWTVAGQSQSHPGDDSIAVYQLVEELRMLTEYRRTRMMQAREGLPAILWAVLIAGGVITVAASCFFGVPKLSLSRAAGGGADVLDRAGAGGDQRHRSPLSRSGDGSAGRLLILAGNLQLPAKIGCFADRLRCERILTFALVFFLAESRVLISGFPFRIAATIFGKRVATLWLSAVLFVLTGLGIIAVAGFQQRILIAMAFLAAE